MHVLTPDDCARFFQAVAARPDRARRWSEARGELTGDCVGRLLRRDAERKLHEVDFKAVPEPELLLVFSAAARSDTRDAIFFLDNLGPFLGRVERQYPGRMAPIIWRSREPGRSSTLLHERGWLTANPEHQLKFQKLNRYARAEGFALMLMTRDGLPLLAEPIVTLGDLTRFVDSASALLWEMNPANPRNARDRLHYLRATRPLAFAQSRAEPQLLIDPLRADVLRQRGVTRVDAKFAVDAEGRAAQVELLETSTVPEPMRPAVIEALRRGAVFLPAIEQGAAIDGAFNYTLKIGAQDARQAAEFAWVQGEARVDLPLKNWMVLKPIRVPERAFIQVDSVAADGTVRLKAVTAGDGKTVSTNSQKTAFSSDWFEDTGGPAHVRPVLGQKQEVDGEKLPWKKMTAQDGFLDLIGGDGSSGYDYCIGYAWTEFESPADMDAWLGIGSDDGLRVWLNGELVNDKWVARTSRLDDDVVPLRLRKGANQLLIKIQNVRGRWSFTCRVRVRGS